MKTIKILNNTLYSIKFSITYKNSTEPLNSNYITSMFTGSLVIPDTAENIEIIVSILSTSNKLIKLKSLNLVKAVDKYYEFIGSETNSTLIELIKYKGIENVNKISFINKISTYTLKIQCQCIMYSNPITFQYKEEVDLFKNWEFISFPIPVNKISSLDFMISIAKKNSSSLPEFKNIAKIHFNENNLKLCYEFSRKKLNLGLYKNAACF